MRLVELIFSEMTCGSLDQDCRHIIKQIAKLRSMDSFEPKRSRSSRYILDASEEEQSFSSPNQQKSVKTSNQQFQTLYVARERFNDFVNELGQSRYSQIREDILSHCQQNSKKEKLYESYMSDETILKIMNLRIDKYLLHHLE